MSMRKKYSGSVVRANPVVPTEDSAPGIWTLEQQNQNQKRGTWPFVGDPNFKDTILLLHGDTSQQPSSEDQSSINHEVTIVGDAKATNFSPYNLPDGYWSNFFDGTGDGLTTAASSDFSFGTGDFTFECFAFATTDTSSGVKVLLDLRTSNNNNQDNMSAIVWNGTYMSVYSGSQFNSGTDLSFPQGQWTHLCAQRISGVLYFSTNGTVSSTTPAFTRNLTANGVATIGGNAGLGASMFTGYISNLRVTKGIGIYGTSNFAIPTAPLVPTGSETKLLTCQSNRFVDNSANARTITGNGEAKVIPFPYFSYTPTATVNNYGSYYFDGTGDRLTVVGGENIGTGDFTISAWVYRTSSGTYPVILDTRSSDADTKPVIYTDGSNLYYYTAGGIRITGSGVINNNAWIFIRLVKESNVTKLFVNGTQVGSDYADTNNYAPTNDWEIGSRHTNQHYWYGYISNLQVVLSALDGTSVPTKPVELTLTEGENSVEFDGTGDYLNVTYSSSLNFGTGDFTIEFWAYQETATGYTTWYSHGYISQSGNILLQSDNNSSNIRVYLNTNSPQITSSSSLTLNAWTHVALVRSSGQVTLYFNGVSVGTSSTSSINLNETSDATIGMGDSSHYLDGYISNMRLTAKALYTGTFTPPTAPFSATTGVLLACASRYIEDRSPVNHNVAAYADAVVSGFNPFNEGYWSVHLDSTSDKIQVATASALPSGTAARTVEFWAKVEGSPSSTQYFFGYGSNTGGGNFSWARNGSGNFAFFGYGTGNDWATSTAVPQDEWFHVSVTSNGSQVKFYLNGTLEHTQSYATNTASVSNLYINQEADGSGFAFGNLKISNFIMYSSVVRTGNFTPPTVPETDTTNVVLLVAQSNRPIDNSSNSNTVTFTGATIDEDIPFELLKRQTKLLNLQNNQDVNNNSFQDSSILKTLITRDGTTTTQGTFSPFGAEEGYWSVFIDGTDDILSVPNSSNHEFGTGQFTVEFWVYMSNKDGASGQGFLGNYGSASNGWAVQLYGDNLEFAVKNGQIAQYDWSSRENNRWYHLAFARDGSNNMRAFIDGTQVVTGVKTDDITIGSNALQIGNMGPSITRRFKGGYISNVRIVKGTALYTSTFTRPTAPLTTTSQGATASEVELLMCQSSSFVDNSSNAFTITLTSTPTISWFPYVPLTPRRSYSKNVVGGSAYFDGSSHIQGTLSSPIGTGDMTVEFWFYPTSFYDYITMFAISAGSTRNAGFNIGTETSNSGQLKFVDTGKGSNLTVNNQLQLNAWKHIACTRSGTTVRLFVNGTEVGSYTDSQNWTGTDFAVGGRSDDGTEECTGYIANLNLVIGTAKYTSDFDQPTSPITTHANTRLLLNFTDGAVIDNTGKENLQTIADAKVSSYVRKFGNGSMYFDGTGDYLVVSGSNSSTSFFSPATDDFTWEMFVRFSVLSAGTLYTLFSKYGSAAEYQFFYNAGNHWNLSHGATTVQWADTSIVVNTWYHIALVKDGTDFEVFRNGTSLGTVTHSNPSAGARPFVLGATFDGSNNATYNLNGYLDDVRITKGVARYTSNFTAPTRAFKNR